MTTNNIFYVNDFIKHYYSLSSVQKVSVLILSTMAFITGLTSSLLYFYPSTEVDAFISQVSQIQNPENTTTTRLIIPSLDTTIPTPLETKPHSVELPTSYFKLPRPKVTYQSTQDKTHGYATSGGQSSSFFAASNQNTSSTISIPKIGLYGVSYSLGNLNNIPDIENNLVNGPVLDVGYSQQPCEFNAHSYFMGHSEPAYKWQASYPGAYIFNQLHTLQPGDIISATNSSGKSCQYQVTGWERVETNNNAISRDRFYELLYPDTSAAGILSIQTCELGSASVRLVLRAKMI